MVRLLTWLILTTTIANLNVNQLKNSNIYPIIRPASVTVSIDASRPEAVGDLIIRDTHGRPAYQLSIVGISKDQQTTQDFYLDLTTVGHRLPDPEAKYESNLLKTDYWGHGEGQEVIHLEHLCQKNKDDPYFGAKREFKLRRMRIVVAVEDFELSPDFCPQNECQTQKGGLVRAKVVVNVYPDASTRARPVEVPYKIKPCQEVKKIGVNCAHLGIKRDL